jgi:hypothetical protein
MKPSTGHDEKPDIRHFLAYSPRVPFSGTHIKKSQNFMPHTDKPVSKLRFYPDFPENSGFRLVFR